MRFRIPHVFALLTYVTVLLAALSYVVPSGHFERQTVVTADGTERTVVVPGSYAPLPKVISWQGAVLGESVPDAATPVSVVGLLSAIPRGLQQTADIVFFIFVLGGVFGVLHRTGVVQATLGALTRQYGQAGPMLVAVVMLLVGLGGSTLGLTAEYVPLVPAFLLLSRQLGYDRVFGLGIVALSAFVGFAAATTNPFTVAVAQQIAEVPLHSGMSFRMLFFACAMSLTIVHLLRYGWTVREDPSASLVADLPEHAPPADHPVAFRATHAVILLSSILCFVGIVAGVQVIGWNLPEMAGGFLAMGLIAALVGRLTSDQTVEAALDGMRGIVVAAMVVGVARAVVVVLDDAQVTDTLVHAAATVLQGQPPMLAAEGMLGFQTVLNLFIPSGSGQASVTMPLMAPLADLLGLSRQVAVFAFQCGDGISNLVIPTSGTLMAMLLLADVPYDRWVRFCGPLVVQLLGLAAAFLALGVLGHWS